MAATLFVLLGLALLGAHGAYGAGEERAGGGGAVLQGPGMEAAAQAAVRTGSQRERGASARGRLGCERPAPGVSRASLELGGEFPGFEGGWGSLPALPARLPRASRPLCVGVKPLLGGGSLGVLARPVSVGGGGRPAFRWPGVGGSPAEVEALA